MQIKFLKSIVENLINKQSAEIIDLLADKKDVNEFAMAKKLNLTINQTRNILYKLSDYGLVSFTRKKDKRKGWYIYFWTLDAYQSLKLLEENLLKKLEKLEEQLKNRRENRYYLCNTCSIEVNEEIALANNFTCIECENVYELAESKEIIAQVEKNINRIKKEIELVSGERIKEEEKVGDKKIKKVKRQEKARIKEKAKLKLANKKLAKKEEKKKVIIPKIKLSKPKIKKKIINKKTVKKTNKKKIKKSR